MTLRNHFKEKRGFTLVVTLTLMILLTIIAVGLLSLSSIALRSSGQSDAMSVARSNARLALMLALGELQTHTGPDQRVTANADLTGVANHKNWLGVWKTSQASGTSDVPVVRWVSTRGDSYVMDGRSGGGVTRNSLFQAWLVSGNVTPSTPGSSLVRVMGPGSTVQASDEVSVPLVTVSQSSTQGGYAYWVSDQSTKACVTAGADSDTTDVAVRLAQPGRFGIGRLSGLDGYDGVTDEQLDKVISRGQADLLGVGDKSTWKRWSHSVTATSRSVLCDTLRGGLKKDLTAYLVNGQAPSGGSDLPAVTDATPLLSGGLRASQGPKFGALRSWASLASKVSGGSVPVTAATDLIGMDKFTKAPNQGKYHSQQIHPVLASAQLYTRFSYIRGYLAVHLFPRIVLWNPYNVKLAAASYTIDFNHCVNDSMDVERSDGTKILSTAYDTRGNKENRMRLTLESTTFAPGEALVFSPKVSGAAIAGRATPLALRSSGGQNLMSAQVSPRQLTNFYITLNSLPSIGAADLPIMANHNKGAYYWIDMMDWWEGNPDNGLKVSMHLGSANDYTSLMGLPLLQLVDTDNWKRGYEGRFNNGRWKVGGIEQVYNYETTADLEPYQRTNYGFRYKWWTEKNPFNLAGAGSSRFWQAAVTGDYNLRAAFCHHSPYDNITDNGESHHWYMWGPYAVEREQGLPYLSPDLAAHSSANGYRANPFFGGSTSRPDHVYPLYDLPTQGERVVSLGRFQHAQLTPFLWHTPLAIGGGYIPSNLKSRDRSADPVSIVSSQWSEEIKWLPAWLTQSRGQDQVVYDLAYEANHELWDRFFLSGSTSEEKSMFLANPSLNPLSNKRLKPLPGASAGGLSDFHRAAAGLLLAGGFNVNTTDPAAWRAFLSSLRGLSLGGSAADTPFPRCFNNPGANYDPRSPYDTQIWTGTRRLTDAQISTLASQIVVEVKKRGPFLSVSDFVNRRLVPMAGSTSATGISGTLQAAIDTARLNAAITRGDMVMTKVGFGSASYEPGNNIDAWSEPSHLRDNVAVGLPTFFQQGDILQPLGSLLVARGDTFIVRGYGEARTPNGATVVAKAWCEAEIQRMPEYVESINSPATPPLTAAGAVNNNLSAVNRKFGRRFQIVSFRWLSADEV